MAEEESLTTMERAKSSLSTYEGGRSTSWQHLPPELLELVIRRLTAEDYRKCRYICTSWRTVVDNALASKGICPPKPQLPFLLALSSSPDVSAANLLSLTQHAPLDKSTQSFNLLLNLTRDIYKWRSSLALERIQSLHGWLILWDFIYESKEDVINTELSFFNPLSRVRFKLPDLPSRFFNDPDWFAPRFTRIQFASAPHSPEFLVAVLITIDNDYFDNVQWLGFFKNNSWTFIKSFETSKEPAFLDIAVHGDKLYAVDMSITDFVFVYSLKDANAVTAKRLVMLDPKPNLESHYGYYGMPVLAIDTDSGELLLVLPPVCQMTSSGGPIGETIGFRVFRLDLSGPRWSEIEDLGDRLVFYDRTRITVISTKDLDGAQEFNKGNRIFFCLPQDDGSSNHNVGVFSLTDKTIAPITFSSSLPVAVQAIWFCPNLS